MNRVIFLIVPALFVFYPSHSVAQDVNPWGSMFDCAVDWFNQCRAVRENRPYEATKLHASGNPTTASLPSPVRNVLDNPSPETARAYVLWSRQANERLAKASEYIAQAAREINAEDSISGNSNGRNSNLPLAGAGPVGLYYFFSPFDSTAAQEVAVLNKIWSDGKIGVVGIPVRGNDEEVVNFVNETRPLFPIRRSQGEVRLVKPTETPDLYLALPLEKKIFRLGPTITETAVSEAIGNILGPAIQRKARLGWLALDK
jgi:hypothetical protein